VKELPGHPLGLGEEWLMTAVPVAAVELVNRPDRTSFAVPTCAERAL
jgi:hypothetical protein